MFFALSKVLDLAVSPLTWAMALLAIAVLIRRRPGRSMALAAAALAVLYAFSTAAVSNAIVRHVEAPAVRTARTDRAYDAVVVLSGEVDDASSLASGRVEFTHAVDRLFGGLEVMRAGRARYVLLSGGPAAHGGRSEPELVGDVMASLGIPRERIVLETRSRNTRENAVEAARIAAERRWTTLLVVTSAAHMPRALGCFRKAGLAPDAFPVDWRGAEGSTEALLPRASALAASTDALRELTGRLVYRLVGYM